MPRSHSTTSLLSQAFKAAKLAVPKELDVEIAFDKGLREWVAFILLDPQAKYYVGRGSNPLSAFESLCLQNNFLVTE